MHCNRLRSKTTNIRMDNGDILSLSRVGSSFFKIIFSIHATYLYSQKFGTATKGAHVYSSPYTNCWMVSPSKLPEKCYIQYATEVLQYLEPTLPVSMLKNAHKTIGCLNKVSEPFPDRKIYLDCSRAVESSCLNMQYLPCQYLIFILTLTIIIVKLIISPKTGFLDLFTQY